MIRLKPPPPIKPGFYAVYYTTDIGEKHVVHMTLDRFGYRSRLYDFQSLNACKVTRIQFVKDTVKDLAWRRS